MGAQPGCDGRENGHSGSGDRNGEHHGARAGSGGAADGGAPAGEHPAASPSPVDVAGIVPAGFGALTGLAGLPGLASPAGVVDFAGLVLAADPVAEHLLVLSAFRAALPEMEDRAADLDRREAAGEDPAAMLPEARALAAESREWQRRLADAWARAQPIYDRILGLESRAQGGGD